MRTVLAEASYSPAPGSESWHRHCITWCDVGQVIWLPKLRALSWRYGEQLLPLHSPPEEGSERGLVRSHRGASDLEEAFCPWESPLSRAHSFSGNWPRPGLAFSSRSRLVSKTRALYLWGELVGEAENKLGSKWLILESSGRCGGSDVRWQARRWWGAVVSTVG